jgi:D-amino peptidase
VWNPKAIMGIRVNKVSVGEIGINAAVAGHYKVPVALVTGDRAACEEAKNLLTDVETVVAKENISRYQARAYAPASVRSEITKKAKQALTAISRYRPFVVSPPITCEVDFVHTACTQAAMLVPGCEMLGPRTVVFRIRDGKELMELQRLLVMTNASAMDPMY